MSCWKADWIREGKGKENTYFLQPAVWTSLSQAFKLYFERKSCSRIQRVRFAHLACRAKQWKEAHEQFEILGDDPIAQLVFHILPSTYVEYRELVKKELAK